MNQLNEDRGVHEKVEKGSKVITEQTSYKANSVPSTTCVSPILEGKSSMNNYVESLILNSALNINQLMTPNANLGANIGFGMNLGFGMNVNLGGFNEMNPNNSYAIPNQFYQTSNFLGNMQGTIPDYYSALIRNYTLNNTIIPQSNVGITNSIGLTNVSGIEMMLNDQNNLKSKEEKQENNTLKLDNHSTLLSSILQSPLISMNSQPAIVSPNLLPRISPIINSYTGQASQVNNNLLPSPIIQPLLINTSDNNELNNLSKKIVSSKKDANSPEEIDKLNSLLNSYLNNVNNLTETQERIRNYINNNIYNRNLSALTDSLKLFGYINGMSDLNNGGNITSTDNYPLTHIKNNTSPRLSNTTISESSIPGEPCELFKLNHTRKYRLGDQGRALLKSELSAYLRNNPEKRAEASKIADIRNATTKQLWQIAAMCGLEERFINLHAQSLAQSKGKVSLKGTKRKSNGNVNMTSKLTRQNVPNDSTSKLKNKETALLSSNIDADFNREETKPDKNKNIPKTLNNENECQVQESEKIKITESLDQNKTPNEMESSFGNFENTIDTKELNNTEANKQNFSLEKDTDLTVNDVSDIHINKKIKLDIYK